MRRLAAALAPFAAGERPVTRRSDPGGDLQCRPGRAALPGFQGQGRDARAAGRLDRVVQRDLSGPARRAARAALRLLRRALRRAGDARPHRTRPCRRSRARARGISQANASASAFYWRAHMTRAIQATSSIGITRSSCSLLSESSSRVFAERRFSSLARTSPVRRAHDDPVTLADARRRRHDQDVAVAIERRHRIAGHFEGEDPLAAEIRKVDLVPAGTSGRQPVIGEQLAGAGLRHADQRHHGAPQRAFRFDQAQEVLERRPGGAQDLGDRIPSKASGRGPQGSSASTC